MKLKELHVDGFGHFRDHVVGPLDSNVTVLHGPNEAGKSTLLAFIRTILFGFPSRGRDSYYPPLAGGRHGGRITLIDDDGGSFTLERFAGPRGGRPALRTESGTPETLERLIGHATLNLFSNVFAFSLDEIQSEGLMSDSEVSGRLYSVGMGASSLPEFRQSLDGRRDSLFRPRGSAQKIPKLLSELGEIDERLRAIQGNADEYRSLTARQEMILRELNEANKEISGLSVRHSEVNKLLEGWDDWVVLVGLETQLRELPEIERFPESAIERLEAIEQRVRQATEDHDDAERELIQISEAAETPIPGEKLLEDRKEVEHVRDRRSSYDDSVRDLPERQAELAAQETSMTKQLRDLGPGWDESRLDEFETSMVYRQEVETFRQRLADLSARVRSATEQLERERSEVVERGAAVEQAQSRVPSEQPALSGPDIDLRRSALRTARSRLNDQQRAGLNLENLQAQLASLAGGDEPAGMVSDRSSALLPLLLGIPGIALIVAGFFVGGDSLLLGAVAGVVLLGAAAYLFARSRGASAPAESPLAAAVARRVSEAEVDLRKAGDTLVEAAQPLDLAGLPTADVLDNVEAQLEAASGALAAWDESNGRVEEAKLALEAQERRAERAEQLLTSTVESQTAARDEWRQWLRRRGLDGSLAPEGVVELTGHIETTRAVLESVRGMRRRVSAIEVDIDDFRQLVEPLAERHGIPVVDASHQHVRAAADTLIDRLEETRTQVSARELARRQEEQQGQRLEQLDQRLKLATQDLAELLAAGDAEGAEDFRHRAAQYTQRQELETQRNERLGSLSRLSGPDDRLAAFRDSLAAFDQNLLQNRSTELSEKIEALNTRRDELNQEHGSNAAEIDSLASEEESAELRMRRNRLMEQLTEDAREWSRLTVAGVILERTQRKFEQERQPSVIRHAEEFFSNVTGNRYTRLFAPVGEQAITVTDSSGRNRRPNELSRGTREQLYLALRFGLIREFGEHAERLPVVVDEALVNFDPERASLAAGAFARLAETNQVLVFTCHRTIADTFADVGAQVSEIGQSGA